MAAQQRLVAQLNSKLEVEYATERALWVEKEREYNSTINALREQLRRSCPREVDYEHKLEEWAEKERAYKEEIARLKGGGGGGSSSTVVTQVIVTEEVTYSAKEEASMKKKAHTMKEKLKMDLMKAFDLVDEDGTGFCPRLDLREKVDTFIPGCPPAKKLSDTLRGLDAMIVEHDEFEELVDAWIDND